MPTNAINDTGVKYIYDKLNAKKVDKEPGKGLSANDYTNADKSKVGKIDETTTSISGNPISISGLKSNQLAINPIITLEPIQAGSGTPSPSNIRAISGYDKIEVLSCGKNIWLNGNVSGTTFASIDLPYALEPGTYTLSAIVTSSDTDAQGCLLYDTTNNTNLGSITRSSARTSKSFTITQKCKQLTFYASTAYQYSIGDTFSFVDIQLEKSNSATSYEPPIKATSISESLGQTVYWLEVDIRSGKAKIKGTQKIDLGNNLNWQQMGDYFEVYHGISNIKSYGGGVCECYKVTQVPYVAEMNNLEIRFNSDRFFIKHTEYEGNVTGLKSFLSGKYAVVELDVYGEIQLTPHEISLLKDYAYLSTNGTSIALDYHNGELASLSDVAQVGETVNELGGYFAYVENVSSKITMSSSALQNQLKAYKIGRFVHICLYTGAVASANTTITLGKVGTSLLNTNANVCGSIGAQSGNDVGAGSIVIDNSSGDIKLIYSKTTTYSLLATFTYILP